MFGASSSPKKGLAPRLRTAASERGQGRQLTAPKRSNAAVESLRWYKRMSRADAQQPANPNTNPTGSLKLTRAGQDIDQTTFFRYRMFGEANWASEPRPRGALEEAIVPVDVIVEGVSQGKMNFKIDHAEYRIAGQSNVSTWFHWGALRETLQRNDFTQAWVVLERFDDGTYGLQITRETPE